MLYIAGVEKPSLPTIYSRFGKTSPAYCSALGKSILAHLPEEELREYMQHQQMIRHTRSTIADEPALRAELAEVRQKGFALEREEFSLGLACIGAPIILHGKPVAAVAIMGRSLEPLLSHAENVQHTAEVISHVLSRGI
jgi:DNA-binding IclR family transcriptional regulator